MSQFPPNAAAVAQRETSAAAGLALNELRKAAPTGAMLVLIPALPEKPKGWTKKMLMHMNMGRSGHSGVYEIFDNAGNTTPIRYQYHTKDKSLCGFTLDGIEGVMSWAQLREAWPAWVGRNKAVTP